MTMVSIRIVTLRFNVLWRECMLPLTARQDGACTLLGYHTYLRGWMRARVHVVVSILRSFAITDVAFASICRITQNAAKVICMLLAAIATWFVFASIDTLTSCTCEIQHQRSPFLNSKVGRVCLRPYYLLKVRAVRLNWQSIKSQELAR